MLFARISELNFKWHYAPIDIQDKARGGI